MQVRFWGTRGSIATPGPATVGYGGNTSCVSLATCSGQFLIIDCGTGARALGMSLREPVHASILLSHTHWDHIQGLPFFIPIFIPGNRLLLHGAYDFVSGRGVEQVMDVQLQYSFFPIREAEMKATIEYFKLSPGQVVQLGSATVTAVLLNHPVINFGYRIDANGKSVFFTGDHEPYYNIYDPADESFQEYQELIEEKEQSIVEVLRGVDVLIADTAYTAEEYPAKKGWGHGHFDSSIDLAKRAGAKILYCTHHEPTRNDSALEHEFAKVLTRHPQRMGEPEIRLAREGEEIQI